MNSGDRPRATALEWKERTLRTPAIDSKSSHARIISRVVYGRVELGRGNAIEPGEIAKEPGEPRGLLGYIRP